MSILKKCITGLVGLSLVASAPVQARPHYGQGYGYNYRGGYGYHGGFSRGHFGTGLALGLGIGALGGYAYGRNYYPEYPTYNYYGYVPSCPPGSYLATDPYRVDGYVCAYQ